VHYYKKNIGDYYKKAGRLTMLQHGSYTLLIDSCYDRERFPTLDDAISWCWASTDEEVDAIKFVLDKFFVLDDGVYKQNRIEEEINKYHKNAKINKRIAREREEKRRAAKKKKSKKRGRSVDEAPPNQEPPTKNHQPLPSWLNLEAWSEFEQHRKDIKKPLTPMAAKKNISILEKHKTQQQEIIDKTIANQWTGLFAPKGNFQDNKTITDDPENDYNHYRKVGQELGINPTSTESNKEYIARVKNA